MKWLLVLALVVPVAHAKEPPEEKPVVPSKGAQVQHTKASYWVPLRNWLVKQHSPLASSAECIVDVGNKYGVDPDLLIAISKAETNLGKVKQRGSNYNIGSVGSYDSTNTTYTAHSYCHGFEQIAQTLNNPHLKHYERVSQLSRKRNHNPSAKVYASSSYNWDTTVTRTMNELKGTNQGDFFIHRP